MTDRRILYAMVGGLLLCLSSVSPAFAHKMKVFASAQGAEVSGYAYFNTGDRAQDSLVVITTADGAKLAEMKTDGEGKFHFQALHRVDHTITVDAGDGHMASFTVKAAELPESLPGTGIAKAAAEPPPAASPASVPIPADADLKAFIDQSVSRQIQPLREQIDAYQEKIWWHDVLGGIGYILGLGGLAFGMTGRRHRRQEG